MSNLSTGGIQNTYIFSFLQQYLLLLIACINYINLTTARSLKRIKEIGVRKVMGALKKQLAFQFITESVLFVLAAAFAAFFNRVFALAVVCEDDGYYLVSKLPAKRFSYYYIIIG